MREDHLPDPLVKLIWRLHGTSLIQGIADLRLASGPDPLAFATEDPTSVSYLPKARKWEDDALA